jgi:putative flippase GtrA
MFFWGVSATLANATGYLIGFCVSFALNRIWTFTSTERVIRVLPKYLLTAVICYFLNLSLVFLSTTHVSVNPYLAQFLGIGVYTICMFLGCRWFVFAPRQTL